MQTPANYWLPAVCSNDGQAVGYECIAQGVNRTYAITSYDRLMTKLVNMGISGRSQHLQITSNNL